MTGNCHVRFWREADGGDPVRPPIGNATSVTEQVPNPFRYIGAVWDSQTGLYQMGERYYDPSVGRFTQEDPLGGGYAYVGGNPVNARDPSGLGVDACAADAGGDQSACEVGGNGPPGGEMGAAWLIGAAGAAAAGTAAGQWWSSQSETQDEEGHTNNARPSTRDKHTRAKRTPQRLNEKKRRKKTWTPKPPHGRLRHTHKKP